MKLLVVQLAAMGYELWERSSKSSFWKGLDVSAIDTVFPALTCPVQASFRTGSRPDIHGVVANGFFDRRLRRPFFWEQSSALCGGERIWDEFRAGGGTVGQICWQQSLGRDSDLILSPAPIHKHHGGMIQDFHSRPPGLYSDVCRAVGREFKLQSYWGPLASAASTRWITDAAVELINSGRAADLQLVYLPHMDYELQKSGPDGARISAEFAVLDGCLANLAAAAKSNGYEIVVFGDYAIEKAETPLFPNRMLLESGLLEVRDVKGMLYPDLHSSRAFAMVDHKIAHVHVPDAGDVSKVAGLFKNLSGVRGVFTRGGSPGGGSALEPDGMYIDHPNSGEIILEADRGCWFAYPWWSRKSEAPEYATHVDIHNKPGFDPCELFASWWPPMSISTDASKVGGTHGSIDAPVLLASSIRLGDVANIADLGLSVKKLLDG